MQTLLGLLFVINGLVVDLLFENGTIVASGSALIGAVLLGYPIVWTAIKDLRQGILSINELVGIAVLAAFASGDYKTAGVVAFFMLMGEIIETRTAEGARASIESLIKLTPTKARRITAKGEEEVPAKDLAIGDVIRIRPGDNVAADGVIVTGQGSFNQATITGESLPVDKKPGDEVFAGTQNLTGVLEIKVSRAGQDTTLGRVRELILAAEKTKLPIMKIVDQYMGFYTPLVLVIAALVWAFSRNLNSVISVIIFSCPCAFILATPTAMVAALSAAARLGILIKNVAEGILRGEEGDHAENDEARSGREPDHARAPPGAFGDERRRDQHRKQRGGAEVLTRDEAETTHRAGDGHESGAGPPEADEQEGEGERHQEGAAARVVESVPDREGEQAHRDEPEAGQERRPARHRSPRDQVEEPGHRGGQHGDREPRGCERGPGRAQQAGEQVEDARPGVGHDDVPVEDLAPVDLRRRLQDAALVGVIHPAERELEGEGERGQRQGERGVASHRVATAATLSPTGRRSRRRSAASTR